jgi:hypothetical protein
MEFDGNTLMGSYCATLSVPMYLAGLQFLSENGSNVYETVAKKAAGLFCLGSAALLSYVPIKILKDDYKRYKKSKSLKE